MKTSLIRPAEMTSDRIFSLDDGDAVSGDEVFAMFVAARAGDMAEVERLAQQHPALTRYEYNYTPPIHFAVREGHVDLVEYFFQRGADPSYRTYPFGDSLLTMAEDREHREVADIVRERLAKSFGNAGDLLTQRFIDSAKTGDSSRIKSELERDARLALQSNETGDTALHEAAHNGHVEIVQLLLDAGARVDAIRSDGWRPVHCALMPQWRAHVPADRARMIVDMFLAHGARYTMFIAAWRGDHESIEKMLKHDASSANEEDTCHMRPISAAARQKNLGLLKLLLSYGADPTLPEQGAPRGSALWDAVYRKQYEMAQLLLDHGADPNAMVESSGTPMMHTANDPLLFDMLLEHGGHHDTGVESQLGRLIGEGDVKGIEDLLTANPALVESIREIRDDGILAGPANAGKNDVILLLMRFGAVVPQVSKWAPYYYFKHLDTAKLLLENGMDPNHMNWHRTTLLHHFAAEGDAEKVGLLLDYGADIEAIDEEYRSTPLGMAARWGRSDVVSLLRERGADINGSGAPWSTPLAWAKKKEFPKVEALLAR